MSKQFCYLCHSLSVNNSQCPIPQQVSRQRRTDGVQWHVHSHHLHHFLKKTSKTAKLWSCICFVGRTVNAWNALPASASDCESVNGFKRFLNDCDLSNLLRQ